MSTVHPMSNWRKHYDISLSGASHLLTYVSLITVKIQENEKKIMKKLKYFSYFSFFQPKFIKYVECLIVFVDIECNIGFLTTTITYEASITLCNYCPHLHATMLHYYNITCTRRMKTTTWCKNNNFLFMGCTVIECLNLFA